MPNRFQPISCYLAVENERTLLIDTNIAAHGPQTMAALQKILPHKTDLNIILTRAEMDCISKLNSVTKKFAIGQLIANNAANPFNAFQKINKQLGSQELVTLKTPDTKNLVLTQTTAIDLGPEQQLQIMTPMLRLLTTFWIRDITTDALFTSNMFGHTNVTSTESSPMIDRINNSKNSDRVMAHLLTKH